MLDVQYHKTLFPEGFVYGENLGDQSGLDVEAEGKVAMEIGANGISDHPWSSRKDLSIQSSKLVDHFNLAISKSG